MSGDAYEEAVSALWTAARQFQTRVPEIDSWSLRLVHERSQILSVRQNVIQPIDNRSTNGAHITVVNRGGAAYAATGDLSPAGLLKALETARSWASRTTHRGLVSTETIPHLRSTGSFHSPVEISWDSIPLAEKLNFVHDAGKRLKIHNRIVDWQCRLSYGQTIVLFISSTGSSIEQSFHFLTPWLGAVSNRNAESQQRTYGGWRAACQGGMERLDSMGFQDEATRVAEDALALLDAPNCPSEVMDLLLTPSQMILQIHESIGHPLELDRILGDERNYAGGSFVTPEMFGTYRYGSRQLNVTFAPDTPGELASYAYDDEGTPAEAHHLIRHGVLERPLGGVLSQARSALPGVANARASSWNRPPIDRMANINLEPGGKSLQSLIGSIEHGVLMDTNRSWSIDDSRNKFQFGCEYARLIQNGELRNVVKNPNYRGVSATFWRSLDGVGDKSTHQVLGVSNCGKGEPNQMIHVGHASPACVFRNVDVFGGS